MNKDQLKGKIEKAWQEFTASFDGLSEKEMLASSVNGDWCIRDIIAHVTSWEQEALKNLPADKLAELTKHKPEQAIQIKLAKELQGLAEKVAKEGKDGTLTVGKIKVVAGKVEVRVQVTSLTDEVIKKLVELGFTELARAKSVKLLIGTIDVTKLEELVKLAEVRRIEPA